ncbi:hypothetical protein EJB05_15892, partial [Eragrostis curvula]
MAKRKEIDDAVTVTTKTVETIDDAAGMGKRIDDDPATEATTVHSAGLAAAIVGDAAGNGKKIHVDDPATEEATTIVHPAGLAVAIAGEAAGNKASTCESAATVDDSAAAATVDEAMATTEHVVHFNNTTIRTMVTKDYKAVADFIQEVRGDHREHLVVGLDTEWRDQYFPSEWRTRKRTALIQLCVGTRCLVYQIYQAKNVYPKILKEFLECPHCKFIGADVENDTTRLTNDFGIYVRNAVDLQPIGIRMNIGSKEWKPSLERLAKELLHADMDKKKKNKLHANWDLEVLTDEHIAYAAIDAFASAELAKPMNIKVDDIV